MQQDMSLVSYDDDSFFAAQDVEALTWEAVDPE